MFSVHGIALRLDAAAANVLKPWLDAVPVRSSCPVLDLQITTRGTKPPPVVEFLIKERDAWLGQTEFGLVVGGLGDAWFSIEGAPAIVRCGGLASQLVPEDPTRLLLLVALVAALRTIGVYGLHAGVVCSGKDALVLLGESGAGKSTTTTALVSAGYGYLGDDEVLLREFEGAAELIAFWPMFRLTERVVPSFAHLRSHLSHPSAHPKWELDASSAFPGRGLDHWLGSTTLLFLSQSTMERSKLLPIGLSEAMGSLVAQSTSLGLACHPSPRQHLDLLALLAARARRARLELGHEWLTDPIGASRRLDEALSALLPPSVRPEAS